MKRLLLAALLLVSGSVARAQMSAPTFKIDRGNAAQDFSATSAGKATLLSDLAAADTLSTPAIKLANPFVAQVVATALALPLGNAEPASPSPQPKFLYGSRGDYRWELGLGASLLRFQSSVYSASAVGINTSVVYFTNEWFGIEGNLSAVYAPTIYVNEHVKIATYGGGPKKTLGEEKRGTRPHGNFCGAHPQPPAPRSPRPSYVIKSGGGGALRLEPPKPFPSGGG